MEFVECLKKECKFCKWDIIREFHCTKFILHLDKKGKCAEKEVSND